MVEIDTRILIVLEQIQKDINISIPKPIEEFKNEKISLERDLKKEYEYNKMQGYEFSESSIYIDERLDFINKVLSFAEINNVDEVYQLGLIFDDEGYRIVRKIGHDFKVLILVDDFIIVLPRKFQTLYNKFCGNQDNIVLPNNKQVLSEIHILLNEYSYKFDFALKGGEIEVKHSAFDENMNNLMEKLRIENIIEYEKPYIAREEDPAIWMIYKIKKGINFDNYYNVISDKIAENQEEKNSNKSTNINENNDLKYKSPYMQILEWLVDEFKITNENQDNFVKKEFTSFLKEKHNHIKQKFGVDLSDKQIDMLATFVRRPQKGGSKGL